MAEDAGTSIWRLAVNTQNPFGLCTQIGPVRVALPCDFAFCVSNQLQYANN